MHASTHPVGNVGAFVSLIAQAAASPSASGGAAGRRLPSAVFALPSAIAGLPGAVLALSGAVAGLPGANVALPGADVALPGVVVALSDKVLLGRGGLLVLQLLLAEAEEAAALGLLGLIAPACTPS